MREDFLKDPQVCEFADWLATYLPLFPVRMEVPPSPYVPEGLSVDCTFGTLIPEHYRWRLTGMAVGDWWETVLRLRTLSSALRNSVSRANVPETHEACEAIAEWAADRNGRVGATAFLQSLGNDLPAYLERTGRAIRLAAPDPSGGFRAVPRMNSTLTKIHALAAADGLPIYESRVAASIATLVETWRRHTGRQEEPLPPALKFPAVGGQPQRRVRRIFPDAFDPGVLSYNVGSELATAARWTSAAVRLGLLMERTLLNAPPDLFVAWPHREGAYTNESRMAAFIGALFMAGYNPACLHQGSTERLEPTPVP